MRTKRKISAGHIYFLILVLLLYAPILLLVIFSFNNSTQLVFPLKGFTLEWYRQLIQNRELLEAVRTSVLLATGSSIVATFLGTLGAIAITRYDFKAKGIFTGIAAMPLVIPYIILGVSLLILYNEVDIKLSALAAGAAHVVISLPYALLIVSSRLVGFPNNLEEAAMDLGTSYWGALLRVTLPICSPALVAAFLICFTLSFDEFAISSFLVGTQPTLPVYLYSQLRFPNRLPLVVTLAAILMVVSMVVMFLAEWMRRAGAANSSRR